MAEETREFSFWAVDEDRDGFVDFDGFNGIVLGDFPLEPFETASVFSRASTFLGTDRFGGAIFQDNADNRQYYLSDTVRLSEDDPVPDPEPSDLPSASLPSLTFDSNINRNELDAGTTEFEFFVFRSGTDLSGTSTVIVAFDTGSTNAADFGGTLPEPETLLTFDPGDTVKKVVITVSGDSDFEPDENFVLTLESPTGAVIDSTGGAGTATGTIINDDPIPSLPALSIAADNAVREEGDSGTTEYSFIVTRTGDDLTGTSTVEVGFNPRPTTNADDYGGTLPTPQTIEFAPNDTQKTVVIPVSGDTDTEIDERFEVFLSFPTGAVLDSGAFTAFGTIINDDGLPILSIAPDNADQDEGDEGTTEYSFTVTRTGDGQGSAAVQVAFDQGDTDAADFGGTLPDTQIVFFNPGSTSETVTIPVSGDLFIEPDENFSLSLVNPAGATIDANASSATGVIKNDDVDEPDPVIGISPAVNSQAEGNSGTTEYAFNVTREGDLSQASAVLVRLDFGDADRGDFAGDVPDELVLFQPNQAEQSVSYSVIGDTLVEEDETFSVSLINPVGATIDANASSADGTIVNDDVEAPDPVISISPVNITKDEGDSGTTEYSFNVTRTGDGQGSAAVQVAFDRGDTNAADFGGTLPDDSVTVFFEPNTLSEEIVLQVSGDTLVEDDETFSLSLINPLGATIDETAGSATGVITNDDVDEPDPEDLNVIDGDDGPNNLVGTQGNDLIRGFGGIDVIQGKGGNDILIGGDGSDVIDDSGGNNILIGGAGNDIIGSNDTPNSGDNIILGGANDDFLVGNNGRDIINGGDGSDLISGGFNNDILTGGPGADIFDFTGLIGDDIITDFATGSVEFDSLNFGSQGIPENFSTEVRSNGTLITVDDPGVSGTIFLLGVTDFEIA